MIAGPAYQMITSAIFLNTGIAVRALSTTSTVQVVGWKQSHIHTSRAFAERVPHSSVGTSISYRRGFMATFHYQPYTVQVTKLFLGLNQEKTDISRGRQSLPLTYG